MDKSTSDTIPTSCEIAQPTTRKLGTPTNHLSSHTIHRVDKRLVEKRWCTYLFTQKPLPKNALDCVNNLCRRHHFLRED